MRCLNRCCQAALTISLLNSLSIHAQELAAGDKFQHVTVLDKMPADQMGKVMNIMSAALGVSCTHCHAGYDFAQEDIAKKSKAREMLTMTLSLNEKHFGGKNVVSCMTCHQGHTIPVQATLSATAFAPPRSPHLAPVEASNESKRPTDMSVTQIIEAYNRAIAYTDKKTSPPNIQWTATRIEPSGKVEAEVIKLALPNRWEQVTTYGTLAVTERYEDDKVSKQAGEKAIDLKQDEAEQIKIDAFLALGLDLKTLFSQWAVGPNVSIDKRSMRVLTASVDERHHTFIFDAETGQVRRRMTSIPTVLGAYIIEVDYEDYQIVGGRMRPTKTVFSMPSVKWERRMRPQE